MQNSIEKYPWPVTPKRFHWGFSICPSFHFKWIASVICSIVCSKRSDQRQSQHWGSLLIRLFCSSAESRRRLLTPKRQKAEKRKKTRTLIDTGSRKVIRKVENNSDKLQNLDREGGRERKNRDRGTKIEKFREWKTVWGKTQIEERRIFERNREEEKVKGGVRNYL